LSLVADYALVTDCFGGILFVFRWLAISGWHIVSGHIVSGRIVSGGILTGWHFVSGHIDLGPGHIISGHHVPPPKISFLGLPGSALNVAVVGWWVGSYPLSIQAPTHVEVELGCDNMRTFFRKIPDIFG
jgi:hypothetical protein